ncbi:hypothetical protein E2562_038942 [Oryza meyeriana var. granulata]|uniref:Uncharacterized protein n=1 Tax=Oryza meyeriana var. granulata TaxID=110450 RepID=A0A6G1F2B7_9ORYZ|nr:hypothetical protein E2562_038942 [Oryza meyeriana var. granulata]
MTIAAAPTPACDQEPSENIDQQSSFTGGAALSAGACPPSPSCTQAVLTATGEAARYSSNSAPALGLVNLGTSWR